MLTWNSACSASSLSFWSSTFRLFFETSSGMRVVDADLQIFEAGAIQPLDALRHQQVTVGDHPGDDAVFADAPDDGVQIGMQQRLAAADGDDGGAHRAQQVDAAKHFLGGNGLGKIVEFIAIRAGKIAAARGNDVHQQRMPRGNHAFDDHAQFAQLAMRGAHFLSNFLLQGHGSSRKQGGRSACAAFLPLNIMP